MATMDLSDSTTAGGQAARKNAPYIPRLSYRISSAAISSNRDSVSTMSTAVSAGALPSPFPTSPRYSTSTSMSSPRLLPETSVPRHTEVSLRATDSRKAKSPSGPSTAQPFDSLAKPAKKEKKGGSLFGFLSVKEPSAQAFEEYQNAMRQKRGRATAVGMPGVSSAKLPPTVPKVNSKWDGVPQAARDRGRGKPNLRVSVSSSSQPQSRGRANGQATASRSRAGTAHSNGSGNRLAEIYGWDTPSTSSSSVAAKDFALEHARPKKTASTTTLPETTLFPTHPPLPVRSISEQPTSAPLVSPLSATPPPLPELPAIPAPVPELSGIPSGRVELHGTSVPTPELPAPLSANRVELHAASADITAFTRYPPPPNCVAELESPISPVFNLFPNSPPPRNPLRPPPLPELQGDILSDAEPPPYQHSPSLTPPDQSPLTPGFSLDSPLSQVFPASSEPVAKGDLKTTILSVPNNPEHVIVRSSGINVLAPPAYARRPQYRLLTPQEPFPAAEGEELDLPDEEGSQLHSILKWENTSRNLRPSLATAYVGAEPNKESSPGTLSFRERFRGGNISSPHSLDDSPKSEKEAERNVTPTPDGGAQSLRRKGRMRLFQK